MQGGTVSYEAIATSLLYAQNSEWMWIFNVLAHYDLPDLSAAAGEHRLRSNKMRNLLIQFATADSQTAPGRLNTRVECLHATR